jgi:hypothetical protein
MNKVILYESWQMECCGDAFIIGDEVKWSVTDAEKSSAKEYALDKLDYIEDHHGPLGSEAWKIITGTVVKIKIGYALYKQSHGIVYTPFDYKYIEAQEANNWYENIDDYEFSFFIVELGDAKTRPITKAEAADIYP